MLSGRFKPPNSAGRVTAAGVGRDAAGTLSFVFAAFLKGELPEPSQGAVIGLCNASSASEADVVLLELCMSFALEMLAVEFLTSEAKTLKLWQLSPS